MVAEKVAIYICSTDTSAGKTMLSVGLARNLARRGARVGYLKPVSAVEGSQSGDRIDDDAALARQALSLSDDPTVLSPLVYGPGAVLNLAAQPETTQRIADAFASVAKGRDAVLVEGPQTLKTGSELGLAPSKVVAMLDAKVLLVARYKGDATARKTAEAAATLDRAIAGVILNAVPNEQLQYAQKSITPEIERGGTPILGVLPLERSLLGRSVAELADYLRGEVLCCQQNLGAKFDSVVIGARSFSSALPYFQRKENKLLVTGIDRPDIQLAALETSLSGIVVTGQGELNPTVRQRALDVQTPVLQVGISTEETVTRLEEFLARARFHHPQKLERVDELIESGVDMQRLSHVFGLS